MTEHLDKIVLETIKKKSSIMPLYKMNYSIFSIMETCNKLEKLGYITYCDNRRILTESGELFLEHITKKPFDIEPFDSYRIERMDIDDIYLP